MTYVSPTNATTGCWRTREMTAFTAMLLGGSRQPSGPLGIDLTVGAPSCVGIGECPYAPIGANPVSSMRSSRRSTSPNRRTPGRPPGYVDRCPRRVKPTTRNCLRRLIRGQATDVDGRSRDLADVRPCDASCNNCHRRSWAIESGTVRRTKPGRVRRTSREESGALATFSRSNQVRLISRNRQSSHRLPADYQRRHNQSPWGSRRTTRGSDIGWRGRIRTFDLLIQSQGIAVLNSRLFLPNSIHRSIHGPSKDSINHRGDLLRRRRGMCIAVRHFTAAMAHHRHSNRIV
jgi:hypothetical protein